jgi:branched-chain amino acid transport system ATP-binding protein
MPETPILEAQGLNVAYGDATALWDVSLTVAKGEIVSVLGPNGAGKTTLVNTIARLLPIRGGRLRLDGADVTGLAAQEMCDRGVGLIPEGRRLFVKMTVEENLELGSFRRAARSRRNETLERIYEMFPILHERRRQIAGTLSGGQQQMLAIGRALMAQPSLLLIDEPSLGLAPVVVEQVFETIRAIHKTGVSILLIEQNVTKALAVAERAYVLEGGRIVTEGRPEMLAAEPHIRDAYLGGAVPR